MISVLLLLPLVVTLAQQSTSLGRVRDGEATVLNDSQNVGIYLLISIPQRILKLFRVDNSAEELPSFAYSAYPNYEFIYSNYGKNGAKAEDGESQPGEQEVIPTHFTLRHPYATPLYGAQRTLSSVSHSSVGLPISAYFSEKEQNTPRYAYYAGVEKLLSKLAVQKVEKKLELV
ncbi:unnamed protein product [Nippostrongylus brasiliensis]|uniref:Secreted protein n=1 Tax=Nippostrongylus brasiliensis TaxID=27835 RepID=A0A0N4YXJ6_NIPBR|nr:unnamed protein product [Nippostrongylus brasiliensis]